MDGIGAIDPNPGANTSNRYQNGHQPNPALGRISVPDRCPRTAVAGGGHARCHAAGNLLRDDRQMRAARFPSLPYLIRRAYLGVTPSLAMSISRHRS